MSQCTSTAEPEDVGLLRCWRDEGHAGPHMSPDGDRWTATETPAIALLLDADGPSGQRQPGNLSDDYGPFNTYSRTVAYMGDLLAGKPTAEAELAALKARRCDGCEWWSSESGATWGFCEAFNDCATKPDHACNAWQPKPNPQTATNNGEQS